MMWKFFKKEEKFAKPINWVEQYRQDLEAATTGGAIKKIGHVPILKEKGIASGRYVFENYQTYGVPPDLAEDVIQELKITYDKGGFEQSLKEHQENRVQQQQESLLEGWQKKGKKLLSYIQLLTYFIKP